jgi:hypothetical protein
MSAILKSSSEAEPPQVRRKTEPATAFTLKRLLARQKGLWALHPVVRWEPTFFAIPTPALLKAAEIVNQSVFACRSGRAFHGSPSFGKTTAIRYMIRCINDAYPDIPVFFTECSHRKFTSELRFYADLLHGANYFGHKATVVDDRRDQVVNMYWSAVAGNKEQRIVLFLDESQNLTVDEWSWLKTIQNRLRRERVHLIVIPWGQNELVHERTAMIACGRMDLVKRFLRKTIRFEGIGDVDALRSVMCVLDEEGRYPTPNGWTFSQFFFPRAFDSGWRLASEADRAWTAFERVRVATGQSDVAMEWISIAIRHFLLEFSMDDRAGWCGGDEQWKLAVEATDMAEDDDEAAQ